MSHPTISTIVPQIMASTIFGYSGISEYDISGWGGKQFFLCMHLQNGDPVTYTVSESGGTPRTVYLGGTLRRGPESIELMNGGYIDLTSTGLFYPKLFVSYLKRFSNVNDMPRPYGLSIMTRQPDAFGAQTLWYQSYDNSIGAIAHSQYVGDIWFGNSAFNNGVPAPDPQMQDRNALYINLITSLGSKMIYDSIFNSVTQNTAGVYIGLLLGTTDPERAETYDVFLDGSGSDEYYFYEPGSHTGYARQKMNPEDWDFTITEHGIIYGITNGTTYQAPCVTVTNNKVVQFPPLQASYVDPILAVTVHLTDAEGYDTHVMTLPLKSRTTLNPGDAPPSFELGKLKFVLTGNDNNYSFK